jgi:UDP-GlcNAc:undecaprenyl-phosphate/decaprenyl-phosphate GlcNAc-1-phosphate transferase
VREYLLALFVAGAVTYLTTGMVRRLAMHYGFMAEVRDRDVHDVPIPRLGGLAMLLGFLAALVVASELPLLSSVFGGATSTWDALVTGAVVICALGAVDDRWGLDALTKLAGQALAAGLMAVQGVQLLYVPWPGQTVVLGPAEGTLLTVLVVVVTVNAVNFVDGLDGLAAGIVGIASAAFFLFAYLLSVQNDLVRATPAALVTAVLTGMCLGFLPHNFNPARIFMGDSGSMLIGLLLAAGLILLTGNVDPELVTGLGAVPTFLPFLVPLAVIAVPFLDLLLAVGRRTRARRSPFAPDKQHLHHRLLEMGHSQRRAVLVMYAGTALLAFGSVALALVPVSWAALFLALGAAGLTAVVRWPQLVAARAAR